LKAVWKSREKVLKFVGKHRFERENTVSDEQIFSFGGDLMLWTVSSWAASVTWSSRRVSSADNWACELMALGHQVRFLPQAYVKAYLKRGKTDAADAEAIAKTVTRLTMAGPRPIWWSSKRWGLQRCQYRSV
jgi:hypothetical protein